MSDFILGKTLARRCQIDHTAPDAPPIRWHVVHGIHPPDLNGVPPVLLCGCPNLAGIARSSL